jgi:hypothetical protein
MKDRNYEREEGWKRERREEKRHERIKTSGQKDQKKSSEI